MGDLFFSFHIFLYWYQLNISLFCWLNCKVALYLLQLKVWRITSMGIMGEKHFWICFILEADLSLGGRWRYSYFSCCVLIRKTFLKHSLSCTTRTQFLIQETDAKWLKFRFTQIGHMYPCFSLKCIMLQTYLGSRKVFLNYQIQLLLTKYF